MLIRPFLRYTFVSRSSSPTVELDVADVAEDIKLQNEADGHIETLTTSKIILRINRILGLICLTSFAYIIVHSMFAVSQPIPDIIQNTFSLTLGYFGSALVTYLENKTHK